MSLSYLRPWISPQKRCGLYDENGQLIQASKYEHHPSEWRSDSININDYIIDSRFAKEHCLYLKLYNLHYGHFITQTLPMFWYVLNTNFTRFVFSGNEKPKEGTGFYEIKYNCKLLLEQMIDILDIQHNKCIVFYNNGHLLQSNFTIAEELLPFSPNPHKYFNKYRQLLDVFVPRAIAQAKNIPKIDRIYVKRDSSWPQRGVDKDSEKAISDKLQSLNFEPIIMEQYNLYEQIALMRNATMIAGFSGTGLHNSLFCDPEKNTQVLNLGDRDRDHPTRPGEWVQKQLVDKLANNNYHYIPTKHTELNVVLDNISSIVNKA